MRGPVSRALRGLRWGFAALVASTFVFLGVTSGAPPVIPALVIAIALVLTIWLLKDRLPRRFRPNSFWQLFTVFWFILFTSALVLDYTLNLPIAIRERDRVAAEFALIDQPPSAERLSYSVENKASSVLVDATYRGALSWSDLRAHFDRVLAAAGWSLVREYGYTDSGFDYGGRVACYGKGDDRANVDSPGVKAGYTYSFSIAWELGHQPAC